MVQETSRGLGKMLERIKKKLFKQSLGHYERKQHTWADEDSLKFVERTNQLMQWLQEWKQSNTDHLAKVRCKTGRY